MGNYSLHSPRPLLLAFSTFHTARSTLYSTKSLQSAWGCWKVEPKFSAVGHWFGLWIWGFESGFGHRAAMPFWLWNASAHCIRYATALRRRWQLPQSQVSFVQCAAEDALAAVRSVEMAAVKWILINFPTPFAAPESDGAWLSCLKNWTQAEKPGVTSKRYVVPTLSCKHPIPLGYMIYQYISYCIAVPHVTQPFSKHHIIHPGFSGPKVPEKRWSPVATVPRRGTAQRWTARKWRLTVAVDKDKW